MTCVLDTDSVPADNAQVHRGQSFKARRKALNWNQQQLANRAGVHIQTVSNFETGGNAEIATVSKLEAALSDLQPVSFETEPVEWGNLLGAKFVSNRAIATFSHAEFMELPVGDVDIVLVTEAGERRCKIGKGDQQKVFGRK